MVGYRNELFMSLHTRRDDYRPAFVQGIIEISTKEVLRKRYCIFTDLGEDVPGTEDVNMIPRRFATPESQEDWFLDKGRLICRWVRIVTLYGEQKKPYKCELRRIYEHECREFETQKTSPRNQDPVSENKRFVSSKKPRYKFNDICSGIGGTSDAARQVGFEVNMGLDVDKVHMKTYAKNFPRAKHLCMSVHDFPEIADRSTHGAEHIHFSCPCQYWSMAK